MKDFFGIGRNSSLNNVEPSPMRRKLLLSCAYLPAAPLLAMLGGCNDTSTDVLTPYEGTFDNLPPVKPTVVQVAEPFSLPLPPYASGETPQILPPTPTPATTPTTVQVTHIPATKLPEQSVPQTAIEKPAPVQPLVAPQSVIEQPVTPPPPPKPTRMKVGIFNFEYNAFKQPKTRGVMAEGTPDSITINSPKGKITHEGLESFLNRALDSKFALLYRAMIEALQKRPHPAQGSRFDVVFFTAPEFYWNPAWSNFVTEEEVQRAADLCLKKVTERARALSSKFPATKYGPIVFLPGTIAMLKPNPDARKADGTETAGTIYEASNYLTCTHNLPLDDGKNRPAYMIWPKRVVSHIDFGKCVYGKTILKTPTISDVVSKTVECKLNNVISVNIAHVTSSVGQSFDTHGTLISSKFENDIVEGLPFGIDICLDYVSASVKKDARRMQQLDERNFTLDFVISAGMSLSTASYANSPFIQYAIHNDGVLTASESSSGPGYGKKLYSSIWKLMYADDKKNITGELIPALGAKSAFDEVRGVIPVDNTSAYIPPQGADFADIPNVLDSMNAAQIRVWSLDVDLSDGQDVQTLVASVSKSAASPIHIID